ncbi:mycothiol synthase [Cryobacterium cryoconiti]|uniref:Mycothiol acetyltransferase n=1 Tax=Cryobacterium cryoconiti TaxID=1259239 RepID=A0A4Y8JXB9_9MICO|nr:mycothiol synthase [Cryobacterium cryoconiti]TFD30714.1 mycothiol synthase [Cryobacterium cryoconiti]
MAFIRYAPDLTDAGFAAEFHRVAAATRVDGYAPFNEQALFDAAAGQRTSFLVEDADTVVGAGILGAGELDLVVDPARRRLGHGGAALAAVLADTSGELSLWSHGDHPAARVLADRFGFTADRTLLQLRLDLTVPVRAGIRSDTPADASADVRVEGFRPGQDDAEWVALNALVFAAHPEQGALTESDLADRRAEPWFQADDFLIARDAGTGRMVGYNWLKIEDDSPVGEIYVIGVHPDAAGRGLGRRLMLAGLHRLRERGCRTADLYVEADSAAAVTLYRSLGFLDRTVDVQYRRGAR